MAALGGNEQGLGVPPSSFLPGWLGCGRVGDFPPECHIPGSAGTHPRALDSPAWPPWLPPGKGGSAPAASGPPACPREALEVQNKINSFNPSNFPQSRSAGSRPVFCGLQWASVSVPGCLCLMTVSQSHVSGVLLCPQTASERHHMENQNQLQWPQWSCSWSRSSLPGYQHSGIPGALAAGAHAHPWACSPSQQERCSPGPPWTGTDTQKMPTVPYSNKN